MPSPLQRYLVLQQALDSDMISTLTKSAESISRELKRLEGSQKIGALVRSEQLLRSQAAIHTELARLWTKVGDVTQAGRALGAAAGAQTILEGSESVLGRVFSEADRAYMVDSARATAARGVESLRERVSGTSQIPLADSVYQNTALSQGKVDEIVNSALARGASAVELARDVRAYINPHTAGGVRYAAMRLGRTELNNAFHASQIREARRMPWVTKLKWNLSGSHPKPDECNDYADVGLWDPASVPAKPHPNCLCYTTPETLSPDDFVKQFEAGAYDEFFNEEFPDLDVGVETAAPPLTKSRFQEIIAEPHHEDNLQVLSQAYHDEILEPLLQARNLRAEIVPQASKGAARIEYHLFDVADGERAGHMVRTFDLDSVGRSFVSHDYFHMKPKYQGSGLATDFKTVSDEWYRSHGVQYIDVHANIDVGGYTWAKQGYAWAPQQSRQEVEDIITNLALDVRKDEDLFNKAKQWLRIIDNLGLSEGPTPYDIAMFGYTDGADTWPGKKRMLKSDWYGRRKL